IKQNISRIISGDINFMKKKIFLSIVIVLILTSICCALFVSPTYELDVITEKLNVCCTEVESILNDYKLENKENKVIVKDANTPSLKWYYVKLNDKSNIVIDFSTNATKTQKGYATFTISYSISDVSEYNDFDVELFTKFVNSVSGKKISTDFVTEFLTSPEEKYSSEKYGESNEDYAVSKMHALNFFEDWFIGYQLTYDNHAELWLYGRTK
ncbi:MAG: hypothetical protein IKT89_02055, partial [Clostridia bacterium]|nr:hypothetical protein [Clostridia bacterium]